MAKIHLVQYYRENFDSTEVFKYCSTKQIAEEQKKVLEDKIQNIKTLYYLDYGNDFDVDLDTFYSDEEGGDDAFLFKSKCPELNYDEIEIVEKELL